MLDPPKNKFKNNSGILLSCLYIAYKKSKHEKENVGVKASRAKLLWGLILAGKSSHKRSSRSRHLHKTHRHHEQQQQSHIAHRQLHYEPTSNTLDVQSVPLNVGKMRSLTTVIL